MIGGCVKMLISNEKKFIYLRVPKTGSTSVSVYLYENLPLEENIIRLADNKKDLSLIDQISLAPNTDKVKKEYFNETVINDLNGKSVRLPSRLHTKLTKIIDLNLLTFPLEEYDIYAVCRNPLDRFLSFQNMYINTNNFDFTKNYSEFKKFMSTLGASQSNWLTYKNKLVNRVFLYEDINLMVAEIAKKYGVTDTTNFNNYNFRQYKRHTNTISPKILEYINIYWQDDFKIYNLLKSTPLLDTYSHILA